ncbi:MAG: response regulator transcription factor [Beijerinckiaceae bacterium]|jgi:two-component system, NarL family, nitrate/nitrite response regulator NarL|nr:response regulator transcription factor [Beijerinckiaceae bacterium]
MTTVIIVDDHELFRMGVAQALSNSPDIECIGEGNCAEDAIQLVEQRRPAVAMLDLSMPGGGIEAARRIHELFPETRILMLTVSEAEEDVLAALGVGALSYVLKGTPAPALCNIVLSTARGEAHLPPHLMGRVLAAVRTDAVQATMRDRLVRLSPKEERTLRLLGRGFSNQEIADATGVRVKTVKFHLANIRAKLGARNRVEAALMAQRYLETRD